MEILVGALFGAIQGFTEFLPISSSGHLVIAQYLFPQYSQPGIAFEVVLHAGTLLAILYWYRREIRNLDNKYLKFIIIGTIPAAVIGLLLNDFFESAFSNIKIVGFALLVTGIINFLIDKQNAKRKLNSKSSFIIGLAQAIAIIPGISRSGSTIFAGRVLGLDKPRAAKFSFLLSVPAVLGANAMKIAELRLLPEVPIALYTSGFLAAFASGLFAISLVLRLLEKKKFAYFGVYCLAVGLLILFV